MASLNLGSNYSIGREGCRHLSASLSSNAYLTSLDVSNNHLGESGMSALAEGLKSNKGLLTLNLGAGPTSPRASSV